MWVIQFNVLRGGERSPEDGSPREFLGQDSPFPLPDIDQTVLHRGEAFVVDDVIWDLERKTVTVELVPSDEADVESGKPAAEAASAGDDEDYDDMSFDEDLDEQAPPEPTGPADEEGDDDDMSFDEDLGEQAPPEPTGPAAEGWAEATPEVPPEPTGPAAEGWAATRPRTRSAAEKERPAGPGKPRRGAGG